MNTRQPVNVVTVMRVGMTDDQMYRHTVRVPSHTDPVVPRARALAEEFLASDEGLLAHSRRAAEQAARACARLGRTDADDIVAAAWLHDIGRAPQLKQTAFHPVDGALALIRREWPERVIRLVAHHSLAVVEAPYYGVAHHLGVIDAVPGEPSDIVIFADMTSGDQGAPVAPSDRVAAMREADADSPVPADLREARYASLISTSQALLARLGA